MLHLIAPLCSRLSPLDQDEDGVENLIVARLPRMKSLYPAVKECSKVRVVPLSVEHAQDGGAR